MSDAEKPLLIVIGGPTGSGKTDLSIRIAQKYGTSIISADSRQVFRELAIGSAAPDTAQLALAKHYFVGSHSVTEPFNAGIFEREALALLEKLFLENPVPIVSGGSGLYIDALLNGMDKLPEADPEIRKALSDKLAESGIRSLQEELEQTDVSYYRSVDLNNPQRLLRALEVIRLTGKPYSSFRTQETAKRGFTVRYFAIDIERPSLYERINQRTKQMLAKGWLEETRNLLPFRDLNALQTVGYKELFQFLDGLISYDKAVELIQQNTRRYAKKQLTWLKSRANVEWIKSNPELWDVEKAINLNVNDKK